MALATNLKFLIVYERSKCKASLTNKLKSPYVAFVSGVLIGPKYTTETSAKETGLRQQVYLSVKGAGKCISFIL